MKMRKPKILASEEEISISVSDVYQHVVEDVIKKVRTDFQSEGLGDNVRNELQSLWELKLMQLGAIQKSSSHEAPGAKPVSQTVAASAVHDLNVPYVAKAEPYETASRDLHFSQVSASTSSREPMKSLYIPAGPNEEFVRQNAGHHPASRTRIGTPSSYMQRPASMNQKHCGFELNMNETYEKRDEGCGLAQMNIPAQGAPPITKDFLTISTGKRKYDEISPGHYITPRDGAPDELRKSMGDACHIVAVSEDYNEPEGEDNSLASDETAKQAGNAEPAESGICGSMLSLGGQVEVRLESPNFVYNPGVKVDNCPTALIEKAS